MSFGDRGLPCVTSLPALPISENVAYCNKLRVLYTQTRNDSIMTFSWDIQILATKAS
jgi:hypothetical protein